MGRVSNVRLTSYVCDAIVANRMARYESEVHGDRFDGTFNFDHWEGAEHAMRQLAEENGLCVPNDEQTKWMAILTLRRDKASDAALMERLDCLVEGVIYER